MSLVCSCFRTQERFHGTFSSHSQWWKHPKHFNYTWSHIKSFFPALSIPFILLASAEGILKGLEDNLGPEDSLRITGLEKVWVIGSGSPWQSLRDLTAVAVRPRFLELRVVWLEFCFQGPQTSQSSKLRVSEWAVVYEWGTPCSVFPT